MHDCNRLSSCWSLSSTQLYTEISERNRCFRSRMEFENFIRRNLSCFPCLGAGVKIKLRMQTAWIVQSVSPVLSLWWQGRNFNYVWRHLTSVNMWQAVLWAAQFCSTVTPRSCLQVYCHDFRCTSMLTALGHSINCRPQCITLFNT